MKKLLFIFLFLPVFTEAQLSWYPVGSPGFSAGVAGGISLTIDRSGTPYVVYQDDSYHLGVTVMKYNGPAPAGWVTVGSPGFSTQGAAYTSIAIDNNGTPYVTYEDQASFAKAVVKKYDGSNWVTVGTGGFSVGQEGYNSIAIDNNDTLYVVYQDGGNQRKATVMKYDGSSWVAVGSPGGFSDSVAVYTKIAIDRNGTPYVVYMDYGHNYGATVMKYNGPAPAGWVTVGSAGFSAGSVVYTSIAIDSGGTPYVAYQDYGNQGKATVMKYNGSSWVAVGSAGFSADSAISPSLAIDSSSNTPYVAYQDVSNGKATVMKYNGSSWVVVGSPGFSASASWPMDIAINNSGSPYVVYPDVANGGKATVMRYGFPDGVKNIDNPAKPLTIFPNPNDGQMTVAFGTAGYRTLQVYNCIGNKVYTTMLTSTEKNADIDLHSLTPGVYYLHAVSSSECKNVPFVIER